jgi:hypothetical protein
MLLIEFLVCENDTVGNIHKQLLKVYGDHAVDRSTVGHWDKWVFVEGAHANLHNCPDNGRPVSMDRSQH